jgi:hypothetical protein
VGIPHFTGLHADANSFFRFSLDITLVRAEHATCPAGV